MHTSSAHTRTRARKQAYFIIIIIIYFFFIFSILFVDLSIMTATMMTAIAMMTERLI